jgi:hypothetical protein
VSKVTQEYNIPATTKVHYVHRELGTYGNKKYLDGNILNSEFKEEISKLHGPASLPGLPILTKD